MTERRRRARRSMRSRRSPALFEPRRYAMRFSRCASRIAPYSAQALLWSDSPDAVSVNRAVTASCPSERPDGLEHRLGVAGDLHLAPDLPDDSVADQEGRAVDPHVLAAIELLLHPASIALDHRALRVGAQRDRQPVLGGEFLVALHTVLRGAHDRGAGL